MTDPLTLDDLTVDIDGYGEQRIWDNRDPRNPVPLDEHELVDLVARVLQFRAVPDTITGSIR